MQTSGTCEGGLGNDRSRRPSSTLSFEGSEGTSVRQLINTKDQDTMTLHPLVVPIVFGIDILQSDISDSGEER